MPQYEAIKILTNAELPSRRKQLFTIQLIFKLLETLSENLNNPCTTLWMYYWSSKNALTYIRICSVRATCWHSGNWCWSFQNGSIEKRKQQGHQLITYRTLKIWLKKLLPLKNDVNDIVNKEWNLHFNNFSTQSPRDKNIFLFHIHTMNWRLACCTYANAVHSKFSDMYTFALTSIFMSEFYSNWNVGNENDSYKGDKFLINMTKVILHCYCVRVDATFERTMYITINLWIFRERIINNNWIWLFENEMFCYRIPGSCRRFAACMHTTPQNLTTFYFVIL